MKAYFQNEISEMRKETKQQNEMTKDEMISSMKAIESKLIDQQSQIKDLGN